MGSSSTRAVSLIKEFESTFLDVEEVKNTDHPSQTTEFKKYGNPFKEICPELLEIHTHKCTKQNVVSTV